MNNNQNKEDELVISPFYKKPMFSTFCRYDELTDVVCCPGVILPSLADSCYVDISVLDEDENEETKNVGGEPIKVLIK